MTVLKVLLKVLKRTKASINNTKDEDLDETSRRLIGIYSDFN